MAEALRSSENICWTFYWVTLPLDKIRGWGKKGYLVVLMFCVSPTWFVKKHNENPRNRVSKRGASS